MAGKMGAAGPRAEGEQNMKTKTVRTLKGNHASYAASALDTFSSNIKAGRKNQCPKREANPEMTEFMTRLFGAIIHRMYAKRATQNLSIRRMCDEMGWSAGYGWRFLEGEVPYFSMKIFIDCCVWVGVSPSEMMKEAEDCIEAAGPTEKTIIEQLESALFALKTRQAISKS